MADVIIPQGPEVTGAGPSVDFLSPLLQTFGFSMTGALGGVLGVLVTIWTYYTLIAFIVCIILLLLYVYASTNFEQLYQAQSAEIEERERIYAERFNGVPRSSRFEDMLTHVASDNPNDWRLAIIEADVLLDELLKQHGYSGSSLGERLKNISATQLESIEDAWQAHKIRNQIAHEGADFILTKRVAEETVSRYRRVFADLGVR